MQSPMLKPGSRSGLYQHPQLYDNIVSPDDSEGFYLEQALDSGGPVLELACGTGRLTLPLARGQVAITGLDRSPAMLSAAREKGAAEGLAIDFVQGDMRLFSLRDRFAMVFVAMNSLLHLTEVEDIRACLACVRRHLAPGGRFIFDIFNPNLQLFAQQQRRRFTLAEFRSHDREGELVRVEEAVTYDSDTQVARSTLYLVAADNSEVRLPALKLRQIFPQELVALLALEGMVLEARYGDFKRAPFTRRSAHQICVCRALPDRAARTPG
jgi:SAM-dependent methyltransferase